MNLATDQIKQFLRNGSEGFQKSLGETTQWRRLKERRSPDRRLNYRRLGSRRFFFPARGWHHHRCAIDFSFAKRELKWKAQKGFNPV
jgi:hypothetical protein